MREMGQPVRRVIEGRGKTIHRKQFGFISSVLGFEFGEMTF